MVPVKATVSAVLVMWSLPVLAEHLVSLYHWLSLILVKNRIGKRIFFCHDLVSKTEVNVEDLLGMFGFPLSVSCS